MTLEFNKVELQGTIEILLSAATQLHSYMLIKMKRRNDIYDVIPVVIDNNILDEIEEGDRVYVKGFVRTEMTCGERTKLFVEAQEISFTTDDKDINAIELAGTACNDAIFRKTPRGKHITNLVIKTNAGDSSLNAHAFIPLICWENNARSMSKTKKGDKIQAKGRLQSRGYDKTVADGSIHKIVTYEASTSSAELLRN